MRKPKRYDHIGEKMLQLLIDLFASGDLNYFNLANDPYSQ